MQAVYAADGFEALKVMDETLPDIVLTDLNMPELDGLELVRRLQIRAPNVPVILMTAEGSEDIAAEALRAGASSYVPKRSIQRDLGTTIKIVNEAARSRDRRRSVHQYLKSNELAYVIGNDDEAAASVVSHLQDALILMNLCSEGQLLAIGTALLESLINAIDRGNLELDPRLRLQNDGAEYAALREHRLNQPPFRDRKVTAIGALTSSQATFTIRDEGPGFDPTTLPDPNDAENLMADGGRGLLLIQMFMDEVSFNERGNEITLRLNFNDSESAG